jgi:hypothetical protein
VNIEVKEHECTKCKFIGSIIHPVMDIQKPIYFCNGIIFIRPNEGLQKERRDED